MDAKIDSLEVTELQHVKVKKATAIIGLGRSKTYELINSGRLPSIKVDGARLISLAAIRDFLANPNG